MRRTAYWAIAAMLAVSAFAVPGNVTTASAADAAPAATDSSEKSFTLVSVMIDDVKFWLPSTIVVDQGDKVKLTLKNQVPGAENQHGFTITGYNITQIVTRGVPTTVSFVADKAGVFPYSCQLHPAHIGGQLIVHAKQ